MKIKILFLSAIAITALACNPGSNNTGSEDNLSNVITTEGPEFEMNILSFDADDSKTEIEVLNRSSENVISVQGRLVFIDGEGNEITSATGRRKTSPFQMARNPYVVKSGERAVIVVRNSIEKGTERILLEEVRGTTVEGNTVTP